MSEIEPAEKINNKKKWLIIAAAIFILLASAYVYLYFNPIGERITERKITIKELSVISTPQAGSISLEPFIVLCKKTGSSKSHILIAEMKLNFPTDNKSDVKAKMYDIRLTILDRLQKDGASMKKDQAESILGSDLAPFKIDGVVISRFELK